MKLVAVDNHVLLWGVREQATLGQEEMIPRARQFFEVCKKDGTRLIVPSAVLGEMLTALDVKHHPMVANLVGQAFEIAAFDTPAAMFFARLWRERQEAGVVTALMDEGASRQELKTDCLIVATSIAHKAQAIYSHDGKLKKFAGDAIPVLEIPRGQFQEPLFNSESPRAGPDAATR